MKKIGVIICAAGAGTRFGGKTKKPFVEVAGRSAFLRSIDFFAGRENVKQILLAIDPADDEIVNLKWRDALAFNGVKICHGGSERFETVANAMKLIKDEVQIVAVHDAVRCCLTDEWVDEVFAKAEQTGAAMLAHAIIGTIKQVTGGVITGTVDRSEFYEAQTPQVFDKELLLRAYEQLDKLDETERAGISDDSMLVEMLGEKVSIVETDNSNIKITHPSDAAIAQAIIKSRPKPKQDGPTGPYADDIW